MKDTFYIWIWALLLMCCTPPDPNRFSIKGKLENGSDLTIYLDELKTTSIDKFDSATVDAQGNFEITGVVDNPGFYKLRLSDNNFVNLVIQPSDHITVTGDATYLYGTYNVSGSRDAIALYELNEYLRLFGVKTDSIRQAVAASTGSQYAAAVNMEATNEYNQMLLEKSNYLKHFVDEHLTSIVALAAVEGLDPKYDPEWLIKLDKKLYELYPELPYVKNFHARAMQLARLAVGSEAPQILLNNPDGETIALSSLRGKIVLIDFWASWCKPCRLENPHVVQIYQQYKDKGFEIYGVSLDRQKAAWVQAIQQDGLTWIHVSDLAFWNSAAVKLYDISSIPQTYLVDREGKIIAKGLRAPELEKKLEELFD